MGVRRTDQGRLPALFGKEPALSHVPWLRQRGEHVFDESLIGLEPVGNFTWIGGSHFVQGCSLEYEVVRNVSSWLLILSVSWDCWKKFDDLYIRTYSGSSSHQLRFRIVDLSWFGDVMSDPDYVTKPHWATPVSYRVSPSPLCHESDHQVCSLLAHKHR